MQLSKFDCAVEQQLGRLVLEDATAQVAGSPDQQVEPAFLCFLSDLHQVAEDSSEFLNRAMSRQGYGIQVNLFVDLIDFHCGRGS